MYGYPKLIEPDWLKCSEKAGNTEAMMQRMWENTTISTIKTTATLFQTTDEDILATDGSPGLKSMAYLNPVLYAEHEAKINSDSGRTDLQSTLGDYDRPLTEPPFTDERTNTPDDEADFLLAAQKDYSQGAGLDRLNMTTVVIAILAVYLC